MKIQRFRKQQYFSHEVAIAVYYTVNYAYKFKPGSENRYLRDFWKITYIEKGSGVHLFNEVRHPFEEGSILLSRPSDLTTAELESDIRLYNILFCISMWSFHNRYHYFINELNLNCFQ